MQKCPNCKARIRQSNQCRRCGADLTMLLFIEQQAQTLFAASLNSYRQAAFDDAIAQVTQAIELHRLPLYLHWYRFVDASE